MALERNTHFVLLVLDFSISVCLMRSKLDWVVKLQEKCGISICLVSWKVLETEIK